MIPIRPGLDQVFQSISFMQFLHVFTAYYSYRMVPPSYKLVYKPD